MDIAIGFNYLKRSLLNLRSHIERWVDFLTRPKRGGADGIDCPITNEMENMGL